MTSTDAQRSQDTPTVEQPISVYLDWLYSQLATLDEDMTCPDLATNPQLEIAYKEAQAALRVYCRFIQARLVRK